MNGRGLIWIGMAVGGAIGGFIPWLFGAEYFSVAGVLCSAAGGLLGIWFGLKLTKL
jgi:hypothetical protein